MFSATRITNGLIALFALLISAMFFLMGGEAMRTAAMFLALVPALFLLDLLLRKKHKKSDLAFAGAWTLLSLYNMLDVILALSSAESMPPELGGTPFFDAVFCIIFGTPLLLNSIYLVRLYRQQRPHAIA